MDLHKFDSFRSFFILIRVLGHGPDQHFLTRFLHKCFFSLMTAAFVLTQTATFFTADVSISLFVDIVPILAFALSSFCIIPILHVNRKKLYTLVSLLERDWNEQRTTAESKIKQEYDNQAMMFVSFFTMFNTMGVGVVMSTTFVPHILDFVMPLNESRPRIHPFRTEWFIDTDEYFYTVLILQYSMYLSVDLLVWATDSLLVIVICHTCGMFAVLGCKLENVHVVDDSEETEEVDYEEVITRKANICVEEHQKTLEFADITVSFAEMLVFLTLLGTIFAASTSLVQLTTTEELNIKTVFYTSGTFTQFYMLSYIGQTIIDASSDISIKTYDSKWYECPVSVQKLLSLMTLRAFTPCEIVARKLYTVSIENYGTVLQTALSYCLVLKHFQ